MSGSYGWNIEGGDNCSSDSEITQMPMPHVQGDGPRLDFSNPRINGCCFCCCCDGEEDNQVRYPDGDEGGVRDDPRGYYWVEYNGSVPDTAVKAGVDKDGTEIYVGRATHEGQVHPAKVLPAHECAYISYDGAEHCKSEFEILCRGTCMVIWQECSEGVVPPDAVTAGITSDDEKLYIGRVFHDGTRTPGKVHPSHGCCYIPYGGEELSFPAYEVLVMK